LAEILSTVNDEVRPECLFNRLIFTALFGCDRGAY